MSKVKEEVGKLPMGQNIKRFRSYFDLGDFDDREKGGGERLTDGSMYEPTAVLIGRMLRGENITPRYDPQYEVTSDMDPDQVIEQMDPTRMDGFDLADVARIRSEEDIAKKIIREANKAKLAQDKKLDSEKVDKPEEKPVKA